MKDKSIFRKIIWGICALHILAFFFLPYGHSDVGEILGYFGGGSLMPSSLTALNVVKMSLTVESFTGSGDGIFIFVLFLLPLILAVAILLINIFGKGLLSYIGSIALSVLMTCMYGLGNVGLEEFSMLGYSMSPVGILMVFFAIALWIACIVGCVLDKSASKSARAGSRNGSGVKKGVRVRTSEGMLRGVTGVYAGAEIPVKSGNMIVIGRNPQVCNVVLQGGKISRKHCTVEYDAPSGRYKVTDYSRNGTTDGSGRRLPQGLASWMDSNQEIHIENNIFRLG